MIFNTWLYGVFLLVTVCLYWLSPARVRPWALIASGLVFYGAYFAPHVWLVAGLTVIVYALAFAVRPGGGRARRLWFLLGLSISLGTLAYFKYRGFLLEVATEFVGGFGVEAHFDVPELRPPLAISFFTFEFVHYLVEVHRGTFAPAGLRDFTLFILFFPTMICGPIKRFESFRPQEYAQNRLDPADVHVGLQRIVFGLAKKTLVADQVAPFASAVFAQPESYGWTSLWLGVYAYAAQIYFDFAGYSDIAIGSARLFGYTVPENFDRPYLKSNVAQFWRAWHMSLTSWITDYVYIPLGGNRRGEARAAWNRFAAMSLCGLWHGAGFHFVAWGAYHGVLLNLYRFYGAMRVRWLGAPPAPAGPLGRLGATLLTFHLVCIGWVLFVCDLGQAGTIIARLLLLRS